jgi:hypothetical protein
MKLSAASFLSHCSLYPFISQVFAITLSNQKKIKNIFK